MHLAPNKPVHPGGKPYGTRPTRRVELLVGIVPTSMRPDPLVAVGHRTHAPLLELPVAK
ncbi:MAG TPA: hypothetical protein VGG32_09070 [Thermoplasmata archaeon]